MVLFFICYNIEYLIHAKDDLMSSFQLFFLYRKRQISLTRGKFVLLFSIIFATKYMLCGKTMFDLS